MRYVWNTVDPTQENSIVSDDRRLNSKYVARSSNSELCGQSVQRILDSRVNTRKTPALLKDTYNDLIDLSVTILRQLCLSNNDQWTTFLKYVSVALFPAIFTSDGSQFWLSIGSTKMRHHSDLLVACCLGFLIIVSLGESLRPWKAFTILKLRLASLINQHEPLLSGATANVDRRLCAEGVKPPS
jgi:hypothetical protein